MLSNKKTATCNQITKTATCNQMTNTATCYHIKKSSDVLTVGATFIIGRNKNVPPAYLILIERRSLVNYATHVSFGLHFLLIIHKAVDTYILCYLRAMPFELILIIVMIRTKSAPLISYKCMMHASFELIF